MLPTLPQLQREEWERRRSTMAKNISFELERMISDGTANGPTVESVLMRNLEAAYMTGQELKDQNIAQRSLDWLTDMLKGPGASFLCCGDPGKGEWQRKAMPIIQRKVNAILEQVAQQLSVAAKAFVEQKFHIIEDEYWDQAEKCWKPRPTG